jgi:thymidylate kinase
MDYNNFLNQHPKENLQKHPIESICSHYFNTHKVTFEFLKDLNRKQDNSDKDLSLLLRSKYHEKWYQQTKSLYGTIIYQKIITLKPFEIHLQLSDYPYNLEDGIRQFIVHQNTIRQTDPWKTLHDNKPKIIQQITHKMRSYQCYDLTDQNKFIISISPQQAQSTNYPHFHLFVKMYTNIIIFEGCIASGKSTQALILYEKLRSLGKTVILCDEFTEDQPKENYNPNNEDWKELLSYFYKDQYQWKGYLQQMISRSRYDQIQSAQLQYPEYLICVRTHKSGEIFWNLQQPDIENDDDIHDIQKMITYQEETMIIRQIWNKDLQHKPYVIFLNQPIEDVINNKLQRNTLEKDYNLMNYLKRLHERYQFYCPKLYKDSQKFLEINIQKTPQQVHNRIYKELNQHFNIDDNTQTNYY